MIGTFDAALVKCEHGAYASRCGERTCVVREFRDEIVQRDAKIAELEELVESMCEYLYVANDNIKRAIEAAE